jgi:hypothetical protein
VPLQATWHQLLAPRVSNSGCCEVKVTDGRLCRPDPDLVVRRRLKQAGMEFVESVILEHDGSAWSLIDLESDEARPAGQVDLVVYAGPRRSLDELSDGLTAAPDLEVVRVGDAPAPRTLLDAVAEGARAGAASVKPERPGRSPLLSAHARERRAVCRRPIRCCRRAGRGESRSLRRCRG